MPTLARHKQLRRNYEVLEEYDAGIVLTGAEVKSCKANQVKLDGSYVKEEKGEYWLVGAHISPYQLKNQPHYSPIQERKLLLHRKEMDAIYSKMKQNGLTLLVESLYTSRGFVKANLVMARGKKKADKRSDIKKRDTNRQIRRSMRHSV